MPKTKTTPAAPKAGRKPKPAAVQPISTPIETVPEVPDWVNETPDETSHALAMWEGGGGEEQRVDLTREEFVLAKRLVATLRGFELRAPLDAGLADQCDEARKLEITQEKIRMVLDLQNATEVLLILSA
jgi:hypothetical protein